MELKDEKSEQTVLMRLLEYCKYLYEEEKDRTDHLNNAVKIYLAFFTFALALGIFRFIPMDQSFISLPIKLNWQNFTRLVGFLSFFASVIFFALSILLTILVLRIKKPERLSNPEQLLLKSITLKDEGTLLSNIIADYAVAANRNYFYNKEKAKRLSYALTTIIYALIFFSISWFFIKTSSLIM